MQSNKIEFLFLKSSIEQFVKDLRKIDEIIQDKTLSKKEIAAIISYLIVARESIEVLEERYSV